MSKHIAVVANGVASTAMQAFGDQISSLNLAALTTYQRNAFGDNTGDIVKASDLQRLKKATSEKAACQMNPSTRAVPHVMAPLSMGVSGPNWQGETWAISLAV